MSIALFDRRACGQLASGATSSPILIDLNPTFAIGDDPVYPAGDFDDSFSYTDLVDLARFRPLPPVSLSKPLAMGWLRTSSRPSALGKGMTIPFQETRQSSRPTRNTITSLACPVRRS